MNIWRTSIYSGLEKALKDESNFYAIKIEEIGHFGLPQSQAYRQRGDNFIDSNFPHLSNRHGLLEPNLQRGMKVQMQYSTQVLKTAQKIAKEIGAETKIKNGWFVFILPAAGFTIPLYAQEEMDMFKENKEESQKRTNLDLEVIQDRIDMQKQFIADGGRL